MPDGLARAHALRVRHVSRRLYINSKCVTYVSEHL